MPDISGKTLSQYRISKAEECYDAAKCLLTDGHLKRGGYPPRFFCIIFVSAFIDWYDDGLLKLLFRVFKEGWDFASSAAHGNAAVNALVCLEKQNPSCAYPLTNRMI